MAKSQNMVLAHSAAKLELFKMYLDAYINVLSNTKFVSTINIYDVFCGTGMYDDGKKGSPLLAFDAIRSARENFKGRNVGLKSIKLSLNDKSKSKVERVAKYLADHAEGICTVDIHNKDADDYIQCIVSEFLKQGNEVRNFVMFDPYGYKRVTPETLNSLLSNKHTEVYLFLPVSFMQRFRRDAFKRENDEDEEQLRGYEALIKFMQGFFPAGHPMQQPNQLDDFEFIYYLQEAFSFKRQYLTTSLHINRGNNQYFAVFFITSNMFGLEKMIEAKWKIDKEKGSGFQQAPAPNLFTDYDKIETHERTLDHLRKGVIEMLLSKKVVTNKELYEYTLREGFKPSHCASILKEDKRISYVDSSPNERLDRLGLTYTEWKKTPARITFKLN